MMTFPYRTPPTLQLNLQLERVTMGRFGIAFKRGQSVWGQWGPGQFVAGGYRVTCPQCGESSGKTCTPARALTARLQLRR